MARDARRGERRALAGRDADRDRMCRTPQRPRSRQAHQEKLQRLGALTYLKLNLKVHRYCQITDTYTGRPDNGRIQLDMANKRCLMRI